MASFTLAWACFAAAIAGMMCVLSTREDRRMVGVWCVLGLSLAVLKIYAIQWMPQWLDTPIDATKFQLNAKAMWLHWQNVALEARAFRLDGYVRYWEEHLGAIWQSDAKLTYASVLGTHEWVYTAFLALWHEFGKDWQQGAILANAAMAGVFPAACFVLVRQLGGGVRVAHLGAILIAIEPSTAVNSAWLLKDTMAGLWALTAAILLCQGCERMTWIKLIALALTLTLLAGTRFVAFSAYLAALMGLGAWFASRKAWLQATHIVCAVALSLAAWSLLYSAPLAPRLDQLGDAIANPAQAQVETLTADGGDQGADSSVVAWTSLIDENPIWAALRSVLRTLMAPYPWVAWTQGLSGTNHLELYLPGTAIWIMNLPAIFIGMLAATRQKAVPSGTLLFYLVLLAGAYILFFGEWSTRQRIFMLPLLYSFAAMGWNQMDIWIKRRNHTCAHVKLRSDSTRVSE